MATASRSASRSVTVRVGRSTWRHTSASRSGTGASAAWGSIRYTGACSGRRGHRCPRPTSYSTYSRTTTTGSIYSLRWLHLTVDVFRQQKVIPTEGLWDFGNPPWPHLRLDLATGGFEEHNNPYPTPDSLYQLADEDHIYETYRDNPTLQAHLAEQGVIDFDTSILQRMADALEVSTDFSSPEASASTGHALLQTCALWSSEYILDKVKEFTQTEGKKLLVFLTHPWREVVAMCNGLPRFDQPFVDYLENNDFMYVGWTSAASARLQHLQRCA